MLWARGSALPQGPPMVDLGKQSLAIARDLPRPSLNRAAGRCPVIARERSIGFTPHARDRRNRHEVERVLRKPARTCWTWGSPEVRDVLPGRAGRSSL